ncbi:hypothetical protein [Sinomonas sp. P47F7]|uniref:hypothetical protein n=1 Tax=Sinomonas sp. P47F7 TaxID=3410987 RepID=UPI003BF5E915
MRRLFQAVNAVVFGFLGTLVISTIAIIVAMFSTRESGHRSLGPFGGVYFEAIDRADGVTSMEVGVENWTVIVVLWLVLSALAFVSILIFGWLRLYRQALIDKGPGVT